jgi:hypothetical protein
VANEGSCGRREKIGIGWMEGQRAHKGRSLLRDLMSLQIKE